MINLTSSEVKKLFPHATTRQYQGGQIVIYQGDQPNHMMYVVSGAVKYYDIDENGAENIQHIIGEQSFFSMTYAFGDASEIGVFYSTLGDTELLLIPLSDFKRRIENDAVFSAIMLSWFACEVEYILRRVRGMGRGEAKDKVLDVLEYLASRHGEARRGGWTRLKFPLSQRSVADLVGISRETVSAVFKEIELAKVLRTPRPMLLEIHLHRLRKIL